MEIFILILVIAFIICFFLFFLGLLMDEDGLSGMMLVIMLIIGLMLNIFS